MPAENVDGEKGTRFRAGWLLLWLVGLVVVALASLQPPTPRPVTASGDAFSAARALVHVRALAHSPHPLGTTEHDRSRETLITQLQRLGLTPHVQTIPVVGSRADRPFRAATVSNVWVYVPGRASTGTVLVAAHYDSVPTGPGAGDNAASVAAILETLRALQSRHGPSIGLRNDLMLLFTDGEEAGLLGARAFVEALKTNASRPSSAPSFASLPSPPIVPSPQKPILALNFEARGAGGPSLMFETGPQNGRLVRQFVQAVPDPAASSLFYAVYKILPNDTDFTEFRGAGMRGLNFAFIDRVSHYHSALDNAGRLDARSLQHQGDNMLGLIQTLGDAPLTTDASRDAPGQKEQTRQQNQADGDAIYFNYARSAMAIYPEAWAMPLAVCATLLTTAFVIAGVRAGGFVPRRLFAGLLLIPFAAVCAIGLIILLTRLLTALAPVPHSLLYLGNGTFTGVVLMSLALACALFVRVPPCLSANEQQQEERLFAPDGLTASAAIWWLLLTWLTTLELPGGSYLFVWPLLFVLAANLAGFALVGRRTLSQTGESAPNAAKNVPFAVLLITAVPAVLLILPTLCLLFSALAITALPIIGALTILTIALLRPLFATIARLFPFRPYGLPLLCAFVGLLLLGLDTMALRPTPTHPQTNSLFYALEGDTGQALWASDDLKTDAWTAQFLGTTPRRDTLPAFLPVSRGTFLQATAPAAPLPPPVVTLLSDRRDNGSRTVRLHIVSSRHAPMLEIAALDTDIQEAEIEGRPVNGNRETSQTWSLLYFNVPAQGLTLTLHLRTGKQPAPLTLRVIDRSYGLPIFNNFFNGFNGKPYTPRPDMMMPTPTPGWYQDTILVGKTFRFSRDF